MNGDEYAAGAVINGTGEAGASVVLEVNGYSYETVIAEDGSWSVTLPAEQLPEGEYSMPVTVTATDARGNSTVITDAIVVDTVPPVSLVSAVETDDVVNAVESEDGVTVTGTGEPGSTVVVETAGDSRTVTVAEDGTWSGRLHRRRDRHRCLRCRPDRHLDRCGRQQLGHHAQLPCRHRGFADRCPRCGRQHHQRRRSRGWFRDLGHGRAGRDHHRRLGRGQPHDHRGRRWLVVDQL